MMMLCVVFLLLCDDERLSDLFVGVMFYFDGYVFEGVSVVWMFVE